jgi:hypothetical protein
MSKQADNVRPIPTSVMIDHLLATPGPECPACTVLNAFDYDMFATPDGRWFSWKECECHCHDCGEHVFECACPVARQSSR